MRIQWISCQLLIKSLNSICVWCNGIHERFYGRRTDVNLALSCICFRIFDWGKTQLLTERKWGHLHVWLNWFYFSNLWMNHRQTNSLKAHQKLWTSKTSNQNKYKCKYSSTDNFHSFTKILFWKSAYWLGNHFKCKSNQ